MQTIDKRQEFCELFNTYIKRDGASKLLEWLKNSDFFDAPASTKFHSAYDGGLCEHSINVFYRLKKLWEMEKENQDSFKNISIESICICGLLHDVCKANLYSVEFRNKKEDGVWVQVPFYSIQDELPYGHGEKSVYIINGFMRLTRDEAMAINWHMGGFDTRVRGGDYSLSGAYEKYPLAVLTHMADLIATYFDEKSKSN